MIRYKVIGGSIPEGARVVSDRGVMKITGVAPLDAAFNPPVFFTQSKLPDANEFDSIDLSLDITPQAGKTLIGSTVTRGAMPWGLVLEGSKITGTVSELNTRVAVDFSEEEAPKWSTRSGQLGNFGEGDTVTAIRLETETPTSKRVVRGHMPWGLTMAPDGTITGIVSELNMSTDVEPTGPGPLFDTARGRLGDYAEFETIAPVKITAVPRTGDKVYLRIVRGNLPWGLLMNGSGEINGSISELTIGGVNENPKEKSKPTVTSQTFSAKVNTPFSTNIVSSVPEERTLLSLNIVKGSMPFGFLLQGSTISGTPVTAGSFTFEIVATDSDLIRSIPTTFTIEVSA